MKRPTYQPIVAVEPFELPGGAKRERIRLGCGHTVEKAIATHRPRKHQGMYCPVCPIE